MSVDSLDALGRLVKNTQNPRLMAAFKALNFGQKCDSQALSLNAVLCTALEIYCQCRSIETTFVALLPKILHLAHSRFGFLAEIRYRANTPYLHSHAVTNIYKPDFGPYDIVSNLQFHNLDTLNGAILTSRQPVISNDPQGDPRRGGIPFGHTELHTFIGLPFLLEDQLFGCIALANRPDGYDINVADFLAPLCCIASLLIAADRHV